VPEVTTCACPVEAARGLGYTVRMRSRSELLAGHAVAAYVTWLAVALGAWAEAPGWRPVFGLPASVAAAVLLTAFLGAFVARTARGSTAPRRLPDAWLVTMSAAAVALLWLGPAGTTPVLLIIVAGAAAVALERGAAVAWLAIVNLAFLAILVWRWQVQGPLVVLLIYAGFQAFAAFTTLSRRQALDRAEELRRVNAELLATRTLLAESARDGERLRVSRELHDVAGHRLTALALNLELLSDVPGVAARREYGLARRLTTELLADIRHVVTRLRRDDGLDLREALAQLAAPFPRPAIHVEVAAAARAGDAERAEAVLRAAQEGLTNAVRHSGAADVWLGLANDGDALVLTVEDDGRWDGMPRAGNGLTGLRERLAAVGGALAIERGARGGLRLTARVPAAVAP
jgi:signal transduction histidine kinase